MIICSLVMKEVWTGEYEKVANMTCNIVVEGRGCRLYRCHLEDK